MTFEQACEIIEKDHSKGMRRPGMAENTAYCDLDQDPLLGPKEPVSRSVPVLVKRYIDSKGMLVPARVPADDVDANDWEIVDLKEAS